MARDRRSDHRERIAACKQVLFGSVAAGIAALWMGAACHAPMLNDPEVLREYEGAYAWNADAFVYLQLWPELSGTDELVAFDESGKVRTLYPTGSDAFLTGRAAAARAPVEARIIFQRDRSGRVVSMTWTREGQPPRSARRASTEWHENVQFRSGDVMLDGTLFAPAYEGKHPAVILVHGSGPQNRVSALPFARFLIRRGVAVLGYDKRGVGESTGDWQTASFDDLAGDVLAAYEYLKSRPDIDAEQIGFLGISQAGWIMPMAAVRAEGLAFLISLSGPGVPGAETTIDHARNEMSASGLDPETIDEIVAVMMVQYEFARTGEGWEKYASQRERLVARIGPPPSTFPAAPDDPYWEVIRRWYFYDPAPTLRRLQTAVLAIFGELDNNVLPNKNLAAWREAMEAGGNRDYTLRIIPAANHIMMRAELGTNAEMPSLDGFVPCYFSLVSDWLRDRLKMFDARTGDVVKP